MAVSYVLNTVFNAVNRFTQPATAINASMQGLNATASQMQVRFNTLAPTLDGVTNGMFSFAKGAAIVTASIAGMKMAFDSLLDYETAVAKFRIVVNELNDLQFAQFEQSAKSLATTMNTSYTSTMKAYEAIAQINPKFAETTKSIEGMSKVALLMARVTGQETNKVAGDLTEIMTIFKMTGDEAMLAGNILANAAAKGGASMDLIAESLKNVGATAVNSHLSLQQTSAMFETMALGGLKGAEAGTKLRGVLMKLQDTKIFGFKTGKFDALEALESFKARLDSITNEAARFGMIKDVLGFERGDAGLAILNNIDYYKKLSIETANNNELIKQATLIEATMAFKMQAAGDAMKNMVEDSVVLKGTIGLLVGGLSFLSKHLDGILGTLLVISTPLLIFKTYVLAIGLASKISAIWLGSLSVAQGVLTWATNGSIMALGTNVLALEAFTIATRIATATTAFFTATIGIWGFALAAIVIAMPILINYFNDFGLAVLTVGIIIASFMSPVIAVILAIVVAIKILINHWDDIKKSFQTGGILGALKAIGRTVIDYILYPLQQLLDVIGAITGFQWAKNFASSIEGFRASVGIDVGDTKTSENSGKEGGVFGRVISDFHSYTRTESTQKQKVDININNNTGGSMSVDSTSTLFTPRVGSTTSY